MWGKTLLRDFEEPAALALMAEPHFVLWGKITSAAVTAICFLKLFNMLHFQRLIFKNNTLEGFGEEFWQWVFLFFFFFNFSKHYATIKERR